MENEGLGLGMEEAPEQEATAQESPVQEAPVQEPLAEEKPKEVAQHDEVPEKYAFEGEGDKYNETVGKIAGELGISQEKMSRIVEAIDQADSDDIYEMSKQWVEAAKKDKEIGGSNFKMVCDTARKVFDKYAPSKELRDVLITSGISNHPDFIRMFYRIGKDMPQAVEPRRSMYPNSNMQRG